MLVHSDNKHFACSTCGIQFKGRDNLLRHTKRYHKTRSATPTQPPQPPAEPPIEDQVEDTPTASSSSEKTLSFEDL